MQEKLKWNAIGLAKKAQILRDYIQNEKDNTPVDHTSKSSKLLGYMAELNHLLDQMEKIEKIIIPKLEKLFRLKFNTPELIMFALTRPSIRPIFDDLSKHFKNDENAPLTENELIE